MAEEAYYIKKYDTTNTEKGYNRNKGASCPVLQNQTDQADWYNDEDGILRSKKKDFMIEKERYQKKYNKLFSKTIPGKKR